MRDQKAPKLYLIAERYPTIKLLIYMTRTNLVKIIIKMNITIDPKRKNRNNTVGNSWLRIGLIILVILN